MKVYVIRHGESETNVTRRWTGWLDVHLTEKGRRDGEKAGEILRSVPFDRVFSSDLARARETAQVALPGVAVETTSLLREIDVGTLENQPHSTLTEAQKSRIGPYGYADFGGESREEFKSRVRQFLALLEGLECENVAVFSHAGWLREMLDEVVGMRLPRDRIRCNNCAVAVLEYADDGRWLYSWINVT